MARLLTELTADFSRGTLEDVSAVSYPSNAAALIQNGRIQPDGTAQRRAGSKRTHASALGSGNTTTNGAIVFETAGGTTQIIVFCGTRAYSSTDSGATWTEIASGLLSNRYSFAVMRVGATNYLFAANGDATVKRWDGATWDTVPNAPSGVKYVAEFNRRLWYAGHSGVILQATKIADPTIIASPDGLTVQVAEVPTGLYQLGPHLLVFSEDQTAYIDGYGEQTIIVRSGATGFSRSTGCIAFRSIVGAGENAVCWLSKRGIERYAPGGEITLVSRGIQESIQTIIRDILSGATSGDFASATYDAISQEYLLADGDVNSPVLPVVNLFQRGRTWFGAASLDALHATLTGAGRTPGSFFVGPSAQRGSCVYSQGNDGFVRRHDDRDTGGVDTDDVLSTGATDSGSTVTLEIVSRPFLFRRPRQRKRVRGVHVASIHGGNKNVTVQVRADGVASSSSTVTITGDSNFDQPKRKLAYVKIDGDAPQVRLTATDDVRIALLGCSAELLRERIG